MCRIKLLLFLLLYPVALQAQLLGDSTRAIHMQEVRVLTDKEKYSRDSAFAEAVYHKVIADDKQKVEVSLGSGVVFHGLFSQLARVISGKKKKDSKFVNDYRSIQSQKYVSLRYNMDVVQRMTGLTGDTAAQFINAYPMEEAFARQASELELKMWIRSKYRLWLNRKEQHTTR